MVFCGKHHFTTFQSHRRDPCHTAQTWTAVSTNAAQISNQHRFLGHALDACAVHHDEGQLIPAPHCVLNVLCTVRIVWFKQKTWSTVQNVQSVCCTLRSSTLFLCKKTDVLAWKQNFSNWPMVFDHFLATHCPGPPGVMPCSECRTPKWLVQVLLAWTGRSGESSTATKNMKTWKHEKWAKEQLSCHFSLSQVRLSWKSQLGQGQLQFDTQWVLIGKIHGSTDRARTCRGLLPPFQLLVHTTSTSHLPKQKLRPWSSTVHTRSAVNFGGIKFCSQMPQHSTWLSTPGDQWWHAEACQAKRTRRFANLPTFS